VEQWEAALERAGFGQFEVTTDVLDGRASTMISTSLRSDSDPPVQNGSTVPVSAYILSAETVNGNAVYQKFAGDLCSSLEQAGLASSLVSWPLSEVDNAAIYVVLDDGAKP
jgi:hypothetical protein